MPDIVIGYDGSESAKRALERAAALAGDGSLTLVSAVLPLAGKGGLAYDPVQKEEHAQRLREAREQLSELGIHCRLVEGFGNPARVIASQAEELGADLIVVGTNHKNLLERLIIGSVSTDVLHRAKTEVLVVP
jgi:nucleotide-binding universal stress UspA family protein